MRRRTLTAAQKYTIAKALRVACDEYEKHVATATEAEQPRLAAQFRLQRASAEVLRALVGGAETLEVITDAREEEAPPQC